MSKEWLQDYYQLKEFIAGHPDIQIAEFIVSIPDDVRPGFYRLFNTITANYIRGTFPDILSEASLLATGFAQVSEKVISQLNLNTIQLDPHLKMFLKDPCEGLVGRLFNPLFDLLKGKTDLVGFEDISAMVTQDSYKSFLHYGYEYWAALSLMCLIAPDKSYSVPVPDQYIDPDLTSDEGRLNKIVNDVPAIVPTESISFDLNRFFPFIVPKVILHSDHLAPFVAIGVDLRDVYRRASAISKKTEWLNIEDLRARFGKFNLWPSICIYLGDAAEELSLEADHVNVARPDIVVDVMENADWYETGGMEIVKLHLKALKPRLGSFVVCREVVPASALQELQSERKLEQALLAHQTATKQSSIEILEEPAPTIDLISVGYETAKLEPIINVIAKLRTKS